MKNLCSVIVAAYNEEKNISLCLECLVNQTYKNMEILIIDDGSTDKTSLIINAYIEKYPNIQYFYQENSGALAARKKGLNIAKGNFITFLDCDDEFYLDTIEKAMKGFEIPEIDIVLFDLQISLDETNKKFKRFEYYTNKKVVDGKDAFINCIGQWGVHGTGIYRKEIFIKANNYYLNFNNKNYINNDEIVTKMSFYYSNKVKISDAVYLYKFNINSTTRKINKNYIFILENSLIFEDICKKENIIFDYNNVLFKDVRYMYNIFKRWRFELLNKKVWIDILKKCLKLILYNNGVKELSFKNKLRFYRMYLFLTFLGFYEK